jgi:hypothetical protein
LHGVHDIAKFNNRCGVGLAAASFQNLPNTLVIGADIFDSGFVTREFVAEVEKRYRSRKIFGRIELALGLVLVLAGFYL